MLGFSAPVLVSLLAGVGVSEIHSIGRSPIWTLYGAAAIHILYYLPTWQGYAGKLVVLIPSPYTFCIICPPGRAMQVSWLCQHSHLTHSVLSTHLVSCCRLVAAREYGQLWTAENKGSNDRACDQ